MPGPTSTRSSVIESSPVLRQRRSRPSSWLTCTGRKLQQFTANPVPDIAFSGRPPSAGGLKRGSRHDPVHVGGSAGSDGWNPNDSLYVTSVRRDAPEPSIAGSQRVFQKASSPEKNA